jgi:hypothetical protein
VIATATKATLPVTAAAQPVIATATKATLPVTAAAQPVVATAVGATQPVVAAMQPVIATATEVAQPVVTALQPVVATAVGATQPVVAAVQPVIATATEVAQPVVTTLQPVVAAATEVVQPVLTSVPTITQPVISVTENLAATTAENDILGIGGLDSLATADTETLLPSVSGIISSSSQGTTSSSLTTAIPPSDTKPSDGDSTVPAAAGSAPTGAGALTGSAGAASSTLPSALTPIGAGSGLGAQISPRLGPVVCGTNQSAPARAATSPLSSPTPGPVPPNRDLLLWLLGSGHGSFDSSSTSGSSAHGSLFADLSKPALWTWSSRRLAPGTVPDPDEVFFPITEQPG